MPTYYLVPHFLGDYKNLSSSDVKLFKEALKLFLTGLKNNNFHPNLRIKRVQGTKNIWEMSWKGDGRATFQYGNEIHQGEPHIIWRRIGNH